jgi:Zn-dependent protease with chaperone function
MIWLVFQQFLISFGLLMITNQWVSWKKVESVDKDKLIKFKEMVTRLQLKLNMKYQVDIIPTKSFLPIQAYTNLISQKSVIFINSSFFQFIQLHEAEFLIAHELIHIKENDLVWMNFFLIISSSIFIIPIGYFFPFLLNYMHPIFIVCSGCCCYAGFISSMISLFLFSKYSQRCEHRADTEGFKRCTDNGKMEGMNMFIQMQMGNKESNSFWINKNGDYYFDILHPSLDSRISKFTHLVIAKKKIQRKIKRKVKIIFQRGWRKKRSKKLLAWRKISRMQRFS